MLGKQFVNRDKLNKIFCQKKLTKKFKYKTKLTCSSCVLADMQCKLSRFMAKVKLTKNNKKYLILNNTKTVFNS